MVNSVAAALRLSRLVFVVVSRKIFVSIDFLLYLLKVSIQLNPKTGVQQKWPRK